MNTYRSAKNQRGITLIAVVMVVLAIGLIAYFAGAIAVKLQQIATERNTVNRMTVVRTALEQYYRAHQNLPDPTTPTANYTPAYSVAVGDLSLEQKFRVDAWGQLYHYNIGATRSEESCNSPAGSIYDILGLVVEGVPVAAVLVSAGPNQTFDSFDPTSPPATYPATGFSKNDDVYVAINLSQQAQEIALGELNTLAKKAYAWDCTCNPSPVPLTLAGLIAQFSLSDQFFHDPWGQCYAADTSGIIPRFLSTGPDRTAGTTDDITVPSMNKCCTEMPDSANPNPTTPLHYWNFNTSGDPGTFSPSGGVTQVSESGNSALEFNGSGYAYAGYPDPASSNPSAPPYSTYPYLFNFERSTAFSIVLWIRPRAINSTLVSKIADPGNTPGYRVFLDASGYVNFQICADAGGTISCISARSSTTVTIDECAHIAVTYDGSSTNAGLRVYVDGANQTTGATGSDLEGTISNAVAFQLSGYNGAHGLFDGIMDDVAIYDLVLGATEIADIWDGATDDDTPEWPFCDVCSYVLPDSDQTSGYTGTFGEDNDYNAAFNTLSYTDNGNGTITDENTCLMWEQKTNSSSSIHYYRDTYRWNNAQSDFIDQLNTTNFASHNDWRLPTLTELISIVNYENNDPAIHGDFDPTRSRSYWSSTTNAGNSGQAWCVDFDDGDATRNNNKTSSQCVRAVRGPALTWGQQFQDNGNGTVTDLLTGLMWQKTAPTTNRNWSQALNYCETLTIDIHTDWRLPNIKELQSLVDASIDDPSINSIFLGPLTSTYWSSTTNDNSTGQAWTIDFTHGEPGSSNKGSSSAMRVRAVRGPQ